MTKIDEHILQIEKILDELILNEEHIRDISSVDPSHEEITFLQHAQESLLKHLIEADKAFAKTSKEIPDSHPVKVKQRISEKLHRLQELNNEFIEHLKTGHHFIHFEVHRKK